MEKNIIIDDTLKFVDGLPIRPIIAYYDEYLLGERYKLSYIRECQIEAGASTGMIDKIFEIYRMFSN